MPPHPPSKVGLLLQAAFGAGIGALLVYVLLAQMKVISPLGTIVVPIITFLATTIVGFFWLRSRS